MYLDHIINCFSNVVNGKINDWESFRSYVYHGPVYVPRIGNLELVREMAGRVIRKKETKYILKDDLQKLISIQGELILKLDDESHREFYIKVLKELNDFLKNLIFDSETRKVIIKNDTRGGHSCMENI